MRNLALKSQLLFLAIFCSALFSTCRKYDEGGKRSGAGKRLIKKWTLVKYTVDGVDSLSHLNPAFCADQGINIYDGSRKDYYNGATSMQVGSSFSCTLKFADSNKQLQFTDGDFFGGSHMPQSPFLTPPDEWQIVELTKDVVKLRMVYGKEYVIVLN